MCDSAPNKPVGRPGTELNNAFRQAIATMDVLDTIATGFSETNIGAVIVSNAKLAGKLPRTKYFAFRAYKNVIYCTRFE